MANSTSTININPTDIQAASQGWQLVPATGTPKRMIVSTQAREKSGKTHFGLTQPGPIAFLNLDRGHEGVVDKFARAGKTIVRKDFTIDPSRRMSETDWDMLWAALRSSFIYAVSSGQFRSVLVDTGSAMWEALRMAQFGRLEKVPPMKYQEVNAEFEALIGIAYNYPVNVVFAHRMKAEYENDAAGRGQKTGRLVPTGYKDIQYAVQINIEQAWNMEKNTPALRVDNCRFGQHLRGMVLEGEMCNFATLGMMVHGVESAKDWEDGSQVVR